MAHTYSSLLVHYVFSTKGRRELIPDFMQSRLWAYMGGIARSNRCKALGVGGTADHIHMLVLIPPAIAVAKCVQLIKAGSSKWMREQGHKDFAWQEAYAAFTIGIAQIDETLAYIENQAVHHARRDYRAELVAFLRRHNIEFEEKYLQD